MLSLGGLIAKAPERASIVPSSPPPVITTRWDRRSGLPARRGDARSSIENDKRAAALGVSQPAIRNLGHFDHIVVGSVPALRRACSRSPTASPPPPGPAAPGEPVHAGIAWHPTIASSPMPSLSSCGAASAATGDLPLSGSALRLSGIAQKDPVTAKIRGLCRARSDGGPARRHNRSTASIDHERCRCCGRPKRSAVQIAISLHRGGRKMIADFAYYQARRLGAALLQVVYRLLTA